VPGDLGPAGLARVRATGGSVAVASGTVPSGSCRTADGERVTILCNVASAAETRLGLANGAAGVGLLRTEIPFTRAAGWPDRAEHLAALTPVLSLLGGKRAVVRLLDFAGDKIPPFAGAAGLPAFLRAPGALAAQLTAILQAGAGTDLAIMIPMVRALDEVDRVRVELARAAKAAGVDPPPLGMMVELAATAAAAAAFAASVDFFSVGTNDLTADVLRRDRSELRPADASERRVLAAIATTVRAAGEAGIGLSVCGDAAADPAVLPELLAVGVRTVSVGAAKVPAVARWIAQADTRKLVVPGAG
jgi:phosphoenolpyruvate-protein kinase (PTS system EI component)